MRTLSSSSPQIILLRLFRPPPPLSTHFPSSPFPQPFKRLFPFPSTPLQTHLHFPFSSSPSLPLLPLQENEKRKCFVPLGSKNLISDTQNDTLSESPNLYGIGVEKDCGFDEKKVSGSEILIAHNCSSLDEVEPESSDFDAFEDGNTHDEILALENSSIDEVEHESSGFDEFEEEKDENSGSGTSEKSVDPKILNAHKELLSKLGGMSVKEKKELGSYANGLGKKLKSQQVGKSGVTESVATALVETLEANELLKIKIHNNCPGELDDVVKHLEVATGSIVVGRIGRTVIIYRPSLTKLKAEEKKKQALKIFQKRRAAFKSSFQSVRGQSTTRTGYSRQGSRS